MVIVLLGLSLLVYAAVGVALFAGFAFLLAYLVYRLARWLLDR